MKKILSIAVPSYNVEKYLHKCLQSFADNRLKEFLEVIIVNDGSTDGTVKIAEDYVKAYPEIFVLINKENGGHGSAVNAGIENATGKYFRIVDGDDWVKTENLIKLIKKLEKLDVDLVVDEKREVHMVSGETQFYPLPAEVRDEQIYNFRDICDNKVIGAYLMLHTLSVRTDLLKKEKIHLLEHIFYVDYEFIVKATAVSKTIAFIRLEIYQYLIGNVAQSVSAQNYVKRYLHHDKVVKEVLRFDADKKCEEKIKQYLEMKTVLIINNHYNISLIFNTDRKEGYRQAKSFRNYLKKNYRKYYILTGKRYYTALCLHFLGIDANRLNKIMRRKI